MRILIIYTCCFLLFECSNNKERKTQTKGFESMNDTVTGFVKLKYPSGQIKETGMLVGGRKNGVWKNYNESGNLISVVYYYKNQKAANLEKDDFELTMVELYDITIMLPSKWIIKKNYKQALFIAVKPLSNDSIFAPTINVTKVLIPKGVSFPQFILANKKDLVNNYEEIKFRDERELGIAGNRAYEVLYFIKIQNKKLGVLTTYIQNGKSCFIVTCIAEGKGEEFIKYHDLFKEVTFSTKFTISQAN